MFVSAGDCRDVLDPHISGRVDISRSPGDDLFYLTPGQTITARFLPNEPEPTVPEGFVVDHVTFGTYITVHYVIRSRVLCIPDLFYPSKIFAAYRDELIEFIEYRERLLERYS